MAGRSRTSTGQNATTLLLRGGIGVDRWERLRGGAFGFGLYKVRNAHASSSTTTSRAMRATCSGSARSPGAARLASSATQRASAASTPPGLTKRTSYTAAARGIRAPTGPLVPRCVLPPDTHPVHPRLGQGRTLLWMADRARECGLVLQADAFPASPENATQAPQDRMALRRSQPAGNAAPIPHGLGSPAHPGASHGRRQVRRPSRVRPSRESAAFEVYQKPHSLLRVDEQKAGRQLGGASGAPRTTLEHEIPCNETGSTSPRSCGLKLVLEE